jgi:RNase P protein component
LHYLVAASFPLAAGKFFKAVSTNSTKRLFRFDLVFSQTARGKAVHRAYAKRALMKIPSLEDYEQQAAATTSS